MNDDESTETSTQPFDINDNTVEPSHRPKHDRARDAVGEELDRDDAAPIRPHDTASATDD